MLMYRSKSDAPSLGQHSQFDFIVSSSPMDRQQNYSSPSYPPSQHFNYNNFTSVSKADPTMSSYAQTLGSEWTFDASSMTDFSSPPMPHRTISETFTEVIDPRDYCQRTGGISEVDQYINSNYMVNSHLDGLVSPSLMMTSNWQTEQSSPDLSRRASLASYGGMNQMVPGSDMSRLHSASSLFAGHQGFNDALSNAHMSTAGNIGHRDSVSDHPILLKSPSYAPITVHHRSRSSIQSVSDQSSVFSPHTSMSRSLSTASSATTASDPSYRPTHSRKSSSKNTRSLAPKATETIEPTGAANMVRIKSSDGTSREVGVLPRKQATGSGRTQGLQKLTCDNCDEVPDGFRGEHELMRHYNLRHAPRRKAFICVEPVGQEGFLAAVGCRSCKENKIYGAYYNAAAHLRRVHFDPRPRGRKAKNQLERRGGKAGGNNPPMDVLKANWIREVDVANTTSSQPQTDNDEDEDETTTIHSSSRQARGRSGNSQRSTSTSSSSSSSSNAGSDDEATLISPSLDGEMVVPAFDQHQNVPYPALVSHSASSSMSAPSSAMAWQTSYAGDAAAAVAWTESESSGMLLQQLSPQFEGLDNGFGYLNQHPDSYLAWS